MIEFKLFGIPVRVEPVFWFTLGLIGLMGPGVRSINGLLYVALFVLAGFVSILIHEMGHALLIRKFKLPTQVVLSSFGGFAMYPAGVLNRKQSFMVSLAGPLLQALSGVAVLFTLRFVNLPDTQLDYFLGTFISISIFWAILNCLPVFPLDGGQMLGAILGPRRQAGLHLTSLIIAVLVAIFAIQNGYLFGAVFMGLFAFQNYQHWQRLKR